MVAASAIFRTAPWGGVEQQDFLNAVLIAEDPDLDCHGWLRLGHELESAADRTREVRWGPRTLDVDIITCDDVCSDDPELTLPHPRAHQRAFVLVPWLDADPDAELPVGGDLLPVREVLARLDESERGGVSRTELTLRISE